MKQGKDLYRLWDSSMKFFTSTKIKNQLLDKQLVKDNLETMLQIEANTDFPKYVSRKKPVKTIEQVYDNIEIFVEKFSLARKQKSFAYNMMTLVESEANGCFDQDIELMRYALTAIRYPAMKFLLKSIFWDHISQKCWSLQEKWLDSTLRLVLSSDQVKLLMRITLMTTPPLTSSKNTDNSQLLALNRYLQLMDIPHLAHDNSNPSTLKQTLEYVFENEILRPYESICKLNENFITELSRFELESLGLQPNRDRRHNYIIFNKSIRFKKIISLIYHVCSVSKLPRQEVVDSLYDYFESISTSSNNWYENLTDEANF